MPIQSAISRRWIEHSFLKREIAAFTAYVCRQVEAHGYSSKDGAREAQVAFGLVTLCPRAGSNSTVNGEEQEALSNVEPVSAECISS